MGRKNLPAALCHVILIHRMKNCIRKDTSMGRKPKKILDASISPSKLPLRPSVRFRLAKSDTFFGPGVAEFLTLVDQTGSMQTACREMEMSYSKGWKIIKKAEEYLGCSLIESRSGGASGGSSHLTEEARDLLTRYLDMEKELKNFSFP